MRWLERGLWLLSVLVLCGVVIWLRPAEPVQESAVVPAAGQERQTTVQSETVQIPVPVVRAPVQPAVNNKTDYHIDPTELTDRFPEAAEEQGEPLVLIVHTHGSEAYTPDAEYPYTPTDTDRTDDCSRNVVRAGEALAALLDAQDIPTLHDRTLHDDPSYTGSYARSLQTVEGWLSAYPSIELVIDLHRDAYLYEDGTRLRTVCRVDGEEAAQLMLVVGTDAGGLTHPGWRENLQTAGTLYRELEKLCPGIMRPIDLRCERFNQHLLPGMLLVELGASGNTLGEALRTVSVLAQGIAGCFGR